MSYSKRAENDRYKKAKHNTWQAIGEKPFVPIPNIVLLNLGILASGSANKVFNLLVAQLYIKNSNKKFINNNGSLSLTETQAEELGLKMGGNTIRKALKELEDLGFIEMTRQGGKNICNLYRLTYIATGDIRDRDGNKKINSPPTIHPTNEWLERAIRNGVYKPTFHQIVAKNDPNF